MSVPRFGGATRYEDGHYPTSAATPSTHVLPAASDRTIDVVDPVTAEQLRLERERAARREARLAALESGEPASAPTAAAPVPVAPAKRHTDRFAASFGLFVLRLVTAAILFVHGLTSIVAPKASVDQWSNTVLPYARYIALAVSIVEVAVAIMLLFGVLTRFAGLLLLVIMGATLAFVMWGPWSPFEAGGAGLMGERELLLAAIGLLLLFIGAGAWSVDYLVRRGRDREGLEF